ncbi:hypothetical protein E6C70_08635 [Glaciibacter flavus]|uniref:HNH domain-containing protein n=1 Tax=Orlajensenia flava TaxID=2565934 RepID=A0A4S4FVJ5_9MICO|nr:hypothetical protein [Glaciibacter flavus]THG34338.1 hypothetical protein E6C70_08635 [Glaciibacter flavus]
MANVQASIVGEQVSELLNLAVSAAPQPGVGDVLLRVVGVERPHGFAVRTKQGLAVATAQLELDSLAGSLLNLAGGATEDQWSSLREAQEKLLKAGVRVEVSPTAPPEAVGRLIDLTINARSIIEWENNPSMASASVAAAVISMVLILLPPTHAASDESSTEPVEYALEGGVIHGTYNRYERSRANRTIAILVHGMRCAACDFDFGSTYGSLGRGYIEVHHRTPVHLMGERRPVDPHTELVPLCANCHRVVHRTDPITAVDELAQLVAVRRRGN